jgi:oxygen-dependent protoporphyrinogen oxidase
MADVVVVGGGIAGLAAAYYLRGHTVTVIDGAAHLGGKLRTSDIAGLAVDEGAEQLLVRRPEAVALATEVGLGAELVNPTTSSASIWSRGRLRPLPAGTLMGVPSSARLASGVLAPWEVARAALDHVLPGRAPVEDVSVASYVGRRVGRAVVDRLVEPLLGGVYAGRAELLSLHATMPQLPRVDGSLLSAVAKSVSAPTGDPVFAAVPGGMQRLVDAVERAAGANVVRGRTVRRIERTPDGFVVVHGPTTDERAVAADAVVVATPAAPAARLLADIAPAAATELAAIDYASVAIVTLAFAAADWPAVEGSGYLVPVLPGRPVKAVTFASSKWLHLRPADVVVVRASIGRYDDTADLQRDDAELVAAVRAELEMTVQPAAAPVASRVTRWGGGLPQYAVGHLERVRRIRLGVSAVTGLAVCGAAYDGVGVPACIGSAKRAATEVLSAATDRSR